jgi:hypothetical protein
MRPPFSSERGFRARTAFSAIIGSLVLASPGPLRGAILYTDAGSLYVESFDSLPADMPSNSSIETVYVDGWRDDTFTVPGTHVSVPGWYLYHPISPANENGFNGNQRLRNGPGQNTGGFWAFGSSAPDTEKALGILGSTTVAANGANMYIALRLVNQTGATLDSFTLTFDGEQWRDGQSPSPETLSFDFSLAATDADWFSPTAPFTLVPELNFTSPVFDGIGTSGTAVDGNGPGYVGNITATVSGISWAPGTELWLRWGDPQLASNADDGLAIDNIRFSAIPEPASFVGCGAGALALLGRRRRSR